MRHTITPAWRALVVRTLRYNFDRDIKPRDKTELAGMVGASKSTIGKMLVEPAADSMGKRAQMSSALVEPICAALGIKPPYSVADEPRKPVEPVAETNEPPDELDEAIKWLPPEDRARAAAILRAAFGPLARNPRDH